MTDFLFAIAASLCGLVSLALVCAVIMNERATRQGVINFYRIGRWRMSLCRASKRSD